MLYSLDTSMISTWLYYTFMALYAITIVVILTIIVSENRNPVKSLAWVTVLLLLPGVGIVLYVFFGRSIKNKRMISRRNRRKLKKREKMPPFDVKKHNVSDATRQQIKMARSLTGTYFYPANDITIFTEGRTKFDSLIEDLKNAEKSINIQYYIFEDDNIGNRIKQILMEKARAGVKVRLIYDHVGSFQVKNRFFNEMRKAGVDVRIMIPVRPDSVILRYASFSYITSCLRAGIKIYLYQPGMLHAKVLIIDDEITSVGSTNFDFRSFEHNFEANLFIYSKGFNERMTKIFLSDQNQSERVMPANWKNRPRHKKILESILRLLSPIL